MGKLSAAAQEPAMWHLADEDGLPSMTVYSILQDQQGFFWLGTENGLCRYDGHHFKKYSNPQAKGNEIISVQKTATDQLFYLNLEGQLFFIKNDSSFLFSDPALLQNHKIYYQYLENNRLWLFVKDANKQEKLLRYVISEDFEIISSKFYPDLRPVAINIDQHSMLLVSRKQLHEFKIARYHPDTDQFKFDPDLPPRLPNRTTLSPVITSFTNGTKFLSDPNHIYKIDQANQIVDSLIFTKNNLIQRLYRFHEKLWVVTESNLLEIDPENLHAPSKALLNANYAINFLYEDAERNLWVGTKAQGIFVIPNIEVLHYNTLNSILPDNRVFLIKPGTKKGELMLGHGRGKMSFIKDEKIIKVLQLQSKERVRIMSPFDAQPDLYNFYNLLTLEFIANPFAPKQKLLCSSYLKAIALDDEKNCFVGTYDATYRVAPTRMPRTVLLNKRTYAFCQSFDKTVWIGTTQGLHLYRKGAVEIFKEGEQTNFYSVNAIVQSQDSTIWVATQADGLLAIKNDTIIRRFTTQQGWKTNTCKNLFLDQKNQLWIGTDQGLYALQLENFKYAALDKNDGLPSNEINAIYADDQSIWIGSPKGITMMPRQFLHRINDVPPKVHITNVKVWEKAIPLRDNYQLSHRQNNLSIDFTGFAYRNYEALEYRYRLLPLDTNWIRTTSRFAKFPSLPPDQYQFQVMAVNADQVSSLVPATLQLEIQKAWWQTWYFQLSAFLLSGILIGSILYRRQQTILAKEKEKLAFQSKLNQLKNQALQSQMNPHFVFNALSAIQKYLTTNEQEEAMLYLAKFARLIRLIFEYSKTQLISLEEEINFLELYLALEKLRFGKKVSINFSIAQNLSQQQDIIKIPPLLIQPIIENAFKHGLLHQTQVGLLNVKFEQTENNYIRCSIEDNGVGRANAEKLSNWKPKEYQSSGLATTEARLKIINELNRSDKNVRHIEIIDLKNDQGTAIGTKVVILIASTQ